MPTVTVPKTEFEKLHRQAQAFRLLASQIFEFAIQDPAADVVSDFRGAGIYTEEFINDLETGLRKSSYAKHYGSKTASARHYIIENHKSILEFLRIQE